MQFGSGEVSSGSHLACARINAAIGAETAHVPIAARRRRSQDLAAGRIDYVLLARRGRAAP